MAPIQFGNYHFSHIKPDIRCHFSSKSGNVRYSSHHIWSYDHIWSCKPLESTSIWFYVIYEMVSGQFTPRTFPSSRTVPIPDISHQQDSSHSGHFPPTRQFPFRTVHTNKTVPIPDSSHSGQFLFRTVPIPDINLNGCQM